MTQSRGQVDDSDSSFPQELRSRYDDVRFLGKGGMGRVFFAVDRNLNRTVAIKLLTHTIDNSSLVVRFHQEARAISKLNNPHVVQVLDFGTTDDGDLFLVMEYIEGDDLEVTITKNGPIPVLQTIEIGIQLCKAIDHAHSHGIVHRDLKPGNIMIDASNKVRILDFGVAKIVDQSETDSKLTRPGQSVGSVLYMSPEQMRGEEADHRSDLYSTALVLYKMIVGSLPHEGESIMKIIRHRQDGAPPVLPPQAGNEELIERLNKVLAIALSHQKNDRYSSMEIFRSALQDCIATDESTQQQNVLQNPRDARRNQALLLTLGLLIIGISIVVLQNYFPNVKESKHNESKKETEQKQAPPPVKLLKNGQTLPHGFELEDPDKPDGFWIAHDTLRNEDLERLNHSGVKFLSLQNNKFINDVGIKAISTLPIRALSLRDTKSGDGCIGHLNDMALENLSLRHCAITNAGILKLKLKQPARLISLDIKYLPVTKSGLEHLCATFPNLQTFNFGETHIKGSDLGCLSKLKKLNDLYVENISLHDKDLEKITTHNRALSHIELNANPITNRSIDYLIKMPGLRWVSFVACPHISTAAIDRLRPVFPQAEFLVPISKPPDKEIFKMFDNLTDLQDPKERSVAP